MSVPELMTAANPWYAYRFRWSSRFSRLKFSFDIEPSLCLRKPRWLWRSTIAGMTVFPVRST